MVESLKPINIITFSQRINSKYNKNITGYNCISWTTFFTSMCINDKQYNTNTVRYKISS
jgi:hypothetical protein